MSLLSLVCLLVVSSSALANNYRTQQRDVPLPTSNYGSSQPLLDIQPTSGYGAPLLDKPTGYGAPLLDKPTGYGAPLQDKPMIQFDAPASGYGYRKKMRFRDTPKSYGYGKQQFDAPVSSYGSYGGSSYGNGEQQFDLPQAPISAPTQWDILCQNQAPLTIIVLSDQASWVVCVDTGKGQLQSCQPGLIYIKESNKCERRNKGDHPCNSYPCKNNGQCVPTSQSEFQCQCAPGFDGETCELDARVCQTQYPCGQEKCQSFPVGAALSYVCIIGGNQAYGPSTNQATPNPCAQSPNGVQPLSYTTHGFLICDGEMMHIKACPGATIWDSQSQACSFPQTGLPQRDIVSSYGGYSQQPAPQRDVPVASYGYGQQTIQRDLPVQSSSYGNTMVPQRDAPVASSGYGQTIQPQRDVVSSYGKTFVPPQQEQTNSYGGSIQRDVVPQAASYGQTIQRDVVPQMSSYGQTIQRDLPVSSYGQTVVPQRDQTQSGYGAPKFRDLPVKTGY